ncbi:MAG: hypothetical protein WBR26_10480 [Candidatus Acidiferrum sp.]
MVSRRPLHLGRQKWELRSVCDKVFEELDEQITDLAPSDFHVFEDGVEQPIAHVSMELPRIRDVQDNISHHLEDSFTPRGIWSSPDLWPQATAGALLSPLPTYLLSFTPRPSPGNSCHRIKVQVRRRHATVYARDEYCNTPHPLSDPIGGSALGKRMEDYADSSAPAEIPLSLQASSFFGASDAARLDVAAEFPSTLLKRKWSRVNLYSMVAILGILRDDHGAPVARFSDMSSTLPWNFYRGPLPPDRAFLKTWEIAAIPTRYETQLSLAPGEYRLQVVITDGEKFGRAEIPVHIQGGTKNALALSDIVLSKRFHGTPLGAQAAARAPQYVPLAAGGFEFTPAADTRFQRDQALLSYFEIVQPSGRDAESTNFHIRITDANTGELKIDTGARPAPTDLRRKNRAIPMAAQVAIDKLPPGPYILEVEASDLTANVTVKRAASFVVE